MRRPACWSAPISSLYKRQSLALTIFGLSDPIPRIARRAEPQISYEAACQASAQPAPDSCPVLTWFAVVCGGGSGARRHGLRATGHPNLPTRAAATWLPGRHGLMAMRTNEGSHLDIADQRGR